MNDGAAWQVTLGIPRLREILMTASEKIKTPAMTLPLLEVLGLGQGSHHAVAEKLRHRYVGMDGWSVGHWRGGRLF
jgi:hypothetical protein